MTALANPDLATLLERSDEFNADACMNCGVCSAICPLGVEILPRRLFRYVLLGLENRLAEETETVYSCLLCKMCEENCPAGVHIAENVRSLRHYILADNLRLRQSVLPISAKVATKWTDGLDLPRGGETVLYTGMMYQLIPYIEGLVSVERRLGNSWLAQFTGLGRRINRFIGERARITIAVSGIVLAGSMGADGSCGAEG